jgi:plastocyanin
MTIVAGWKAYAIAAAGGAVLALGITAPVWAQKAARVAISGFSFSPGSVTVAKGGTVTWVNNDGEAHSVVVSSTSQRTPTLQKGKSARLSFKNAGSFSYVCGIHSSMTGTVVVK